MCMERVKSFFFIGLIITTILAACSPVKAAESTLMPTVSTLPDPTDRPTDVVRQFNILLDPKLPADFKESFQVSEPFILTDSNDNIETIVSINAEGESIANWVYAVVAPFPTLDDSIDLDDLKSTWQAEGVNFEKFGALWMSEDTHAVFEKMWGKAAKTGIKIVAEEDFVNQCWDAEKCWGIIPFEQIEPRLKVLYVDGLSPLQRGELDPAYRLQVNITLTGDQVVIDKIKTLSVDHKVAWKKTNRDPQKFTLLVMTGVTALVRATAERMDTLGVTYPGRDIKHWLVDADLTHVCNEVSFDSRCPPGNPNQLSLQFCSRDEYIGLLEDLGVDIVELSGNHVMDWGVSALLNSLDMYEERGIKTFAGGRDLASAKQPLLIEDHGNRLAFMGCNPAGPAYAWATERSPGSLPCEYPEFYETITWLKEEGYQVIVTQQYYESYSHEPNISQVNDFRKLSDAGAVIVSGSQSHFPQAMEFRDSGFIHYGLGNLFFDQMTFPNPGTRREFIDRHYFYDGKYIGTELLTAMLEDYARPRPMTVEERQQLLTDVFRASGWLKEVQK